MLAKDVLAKEQEYHKGWLASGEARPTKQGGLEVFDYVPKGRSDYYYNEKTAKNLIVLHYTMGWFWGDLPTLTTPHYHVSVSYVVARSGWIYRLFDPNLWASHLGTEQNVIGGSKFNGQRSIAIEISNVGTLAESGKDLTFINSKYCGKDETAYYTQLGKPFRGQKWFASFTNEQYFAVNALLDQLCEQFKIKRAFLPADRRFVTFKNAADAQSYKGIASHVNFRRTGKTDIGPAFDWKKIGG